MHVGVFRSLFAGRASAHSNGLNDAIIDMPSQGAGLLLKFSPCRHGSAN